MAGEVKVNDSRLRSFRKRIAPMQKGISVTVGVQGKEAESEYEDGTPTVVVAAVHEFGSTDGRIPSRSYLRSTYDENRRKYEQQITKGARETAGGKTTAKQTMFKAGETLRRDIISKIKAGIPPPLSQRTIDAKGSSVPLIDTGQLVASITSIVHEGKPK
jgi:phage gpG-like protein